MSDHDPVIEDSSSKIPFIDNPMIPLRDKQEDFLLMILRMKSQPYFLVQLRHITHNNPLEKLIQIWIRCNLA